MGTVESKNIIGVSTKIINNSVITGTNTCQIKVFDGESITVVNSGNVTIANNDFEQQMLIKQNCINKSESNVAVNNNVANVTSQIAKAVNQEFNIASGSTEAQNINKIFTDMGNDIKASYHQRCYQFLEAGEHVTVTDSGNVFIHNNNFSSNINDTVNCIQKDLVIENYVNRLNNQISQKATSEVKSLLGGLILIVVIILIIGGGMLLMGEKALFNWKLWLAVILAIVIYLVFASIAKIWPFNKKSASKHDNTDLLI